MADSGVFVRLSFPKGEHRDVIVQSGEVTVGSAPDNNVVLTADGTQPRLATIIIDQRGYTLVVSSPDAGAHVNGRPVREKALLRLGDVVSLRSVNMVLKPDADDVIRKPSRARPDASTATPDRAANTGPPRAVLRGVSGAYFGKTVPIRGRMVIGRTSDCELVLDEPEIAGHHAAIEVYQGEIALRDLGSANGTTINGVQVRDAALHSGDQIAFERNRFLLEAPGMPLRRAQLTPAITPQPGTNDSRAPIEVTQTLRAIKVEDKPAPVAQPQPEPVPASTQAAWSPWWLIVAGALIAVAIALLFLGTR